MTDSNKILVGKIVAPQGIRGEVRVHTYTAGADDFRTLQVLGLPLKFVRTAGRDIAICRVDGVADRNAAEALRGTELFISRDALPATGANEYYQADLIGFDVFQNNEKIGRVACFQNFGAGDIIELEDGEMLSFIGANVDTENRRITVK
ncbi:MAG: ribosome maturation factor RimM [Alphaproteobacteria bacterium]|nr:ribosome maturation factor RimM [Alphaproteobacteria bacterium]